MNEFATMFQQAVSGFQAMSAWEYLAAGLSIAYMLLAMKQSAWCWVAGGISTLIYTLLFFNGALLMESLLNLFYLVMAVYGWWQWRQGALLGDKLALVEQSALPIVSWSVKKHMWLICTTLIISILVGYIMDNYTYADFAYLDSLTTCFGVVTTYLLAKKVLENWLYWVVIDAVSIYLYVSKGYFPTTVLFVFYTILAAVNYVQWRAALKQQTVSMIK